MNTAEKLDFNSATQANVSGYSVDGLLFDMDGTVLTSIAASERVWTQWAQKHGLDVEEFLATVHGVRTIDTVRNSGVTGIDVEAETQAIMDAEVADIDGIEPVTGAPEFLASLPADRWAIVTSAPRRLAERRIAAAGLPMPRVLVTGDDVEHGKPAPDPFILGARQLGYPVSRCLVFEDAPAGVEAAEAAGAPVVVITATHPTDMETGHAKIADYRHTKVLVDGDGHMGVRLT